MEKTLVKREDVQLQNREGQTLECSHFLPEGPTLQDCVVYLHCNSGSRVEALQLLPALAKESIQLFCLDFSGSGISQGSYVTLGEKESGDIQTVLRYLQGLGSVRKIALWGRSMGAVAAFLCLSRNRFNHGVSCLVSDSPFCRLHTLVKELAKKTLKLPDLITNLVMTMVYKSVRNKTGFDLQSIDLAENVQYVDTPCLFVASENDSVVDIHHTYDIMHKYQGSKEIFLVFQDHNDFRGNNMITHAVQFIKTQLSLRPEDVPYQTRGQENKHNISMA